MRSGSSRALALMTMLALGACVGSVEVVGTAERPRRTQPPAPVQTVEGPASSGAGSGPAEDDPSRTGAGSSGRTEPYRGLGTWIDIYDTEVWERPVRAVRRMAAHGVRTIYVQTSNFSRGVPFVHLEGVEAIVDEAHRLDLAVVAWYLPGFRDLSTDLHRTLRSIGFRTAAGNGFDSFALDIESPEVRRPRVRTARLLHLSARIRRAAGPGYPLGAIVASPHRMVRTDPRFWPGFPWRRLAETYDVFLPMTYYTYRVQGSRAAARYTAQNVQIIRHQTAGLRVLIHVVGGISFDATGPETRGFVRTVRRKKVIGASYYTFPGITTKQWRALRALREHDPNV